MFGVATDDAHHFADAAERARVGKFAYVGDRAWIMLRADKTPPDIRAAFEAGDFYASTGVSLASLSHDSGRADAVGRAGSRAELRDSIRGHVRARTRSKLQSVGAT